jgi:dolichol-phosphate mannosyltransferase
MNRGETDMETKPYSPTEVLEFTEDRRPVAVEAAPPALAFPTLSIIVPTKNEAGNIAPLLKRVKQAIGAISTEVIFVDDSVDETPQVIEQLSEHYRPVETTVFVRPPECRQDGLGGAVLEGLRLARAPWVCVMDGDLQHPPELIPHLLEQAQNAQADLVIASRRTSASDASALGPVRTAISRSLDIFARLLFPVQLRRVSDPLTGFFLVRREALNLDQLRPRGFKILLEMLIRFPALKVIEVPFHFGNRAAGQSKAGMREGLTYLNQLWQLRFGSEQAGRLLAFLLVGGSGVVVNSLLLAAATEWLGLHYLVSAAVATVGSTIWNFIFTEVWVFQNRPTAQERPLRFTLFLLMNVGALALRGPILFMLTSGLGIHYLLSNLISLAALMLIRFAFADKLIWSETRPLGSLFRLDRPAVPNSTPAAAAARKPGKEKAMSNKYLYNVDGILSIASEVVLPELERFAADMLPGPVDIRVRLGQRGAPRSAESGASGATRIVYDEGWGPLGFWAEIEMGDPIEVTASPLLRWSPHVLYTNLVEPILRWTFVRKGYALVHSACIGFGGKAYLVTAKTDTGKTTTLLRILSQQRRMSDEGAFISDDLTLVSPDGKVLTYPKPLTISHHTVQAINSKCLSVAQRLALLFQSRIHSRGGRRFALDLTRSKLPMATINAYVQMLIPPPKYQVNQLIPGVRLAREASLSGLFVIERSLTNQEWDLDGDEALETLLSNCEDAYGFPPYHSIKESLYHVDGQDLRTFERAIIAEALQNLPAMLIRSSNAEWWRRIPAFVDARVAADFERRKRTRSALQTKAARA